MQWLQSRTKVTVVHAGLLLPQLLLKERMPSTLASSCPSQSSNGYLVSKTRKLMVTSQSQSLAATVVRVATTTLVTLTL